MKPTLYLYHYLKPAKLSVGGRTLELNKGDQFVLDTFQNRTVVVRDGYRFPINEKYVKAFLQRCEKLSPTKEYLSVRSDFNRYGHTLRKYFQYWASKFAGDSKVTSDFARNEVYARWELRGNPGVFCAFRASQNTISVGVYHSGSFNVRSWKTWPQLQQTLARIAKRMLKEGLWVDDLQTRKSKLANITMPWGVFSGQVDYCIASFKFEG